MGAWAGRCVIAHLDDFWGAFLKIPCIVSPGQHCRAGEAVLVALALALSTRHMDSSILVSTLEFLLINFLMVVDQTSSVLWSSIPLPFRRVMYHSRVICFQFPLAFFSAVAKLTFVLKSVGQRCAIAPFEFTLWEVIAPHLSASFTLDPSA
jgi:hypothetical protein